MRRRRTCADWAALHWRSNQARAQRCPQSATRPGTGRSVGPSARAPASTPASPALRWCGGPPRLQILHLVGVLSLDQPFHIPAIGTASIDEYNNYDTLCFIVQAHLAFALSTFYIPPAYLSIAVNSKFINFNDLPSFNKLVTSV